MKGAPLRQTAQLSGLDLLYDPAHPSQFSLPQHQLVLRLYEEKARQVPLLHGSIETRSHLLSLTFQSPHPLLQKRDSLLGRKRGQKREPGRKLRVLLDRLPHKLTQPGKELLASQAGYLIDRPFGTSPLAYRLPRHDEPLPLQRRHHRVQRAVPEPHRFVLAPLAHQRNHLVRVHRPLVEKRHHRQSQRIGYLSLRRHQNSFSRYKLVEIDYTHGLAWCQAERELPSFQRGLSGRKRKSTAPGAPLLQYFAIYSITYEAYFLASTMRWSLIEVNGSPSKPPLTASTSKPVSCNINSSSPRPTTRMVRSWALRLSSAPEAPYRS